MNEMVGKRRVYKNFNFPCIDIAQIHFWKTLISLQNRCFDDLLSYISSEQIAIFAPQALPELFAKTQESD